MSNITFQSTNSTQLYLNSSNANMYLNQTKKSNVVFFFDNVLKIDKTSIEMKLSLVNAQIPVSWFLINDSNNRIVITTTQNSYNYLLFSEWQLQRKYFYLYMDIIIWISMGDNI